MQNMMQFLPFILMFLVLYLLIMRPQMKKQKEHQKMLASLTKGDQIVTIGGVIGKITAAPAEKNELKIKIADGVEVKIERSAVAKKLD